MWPLNGENSFADETKPNFSSMHPTQEKWGWVEPKGVGRLVVQTGRNEDRSLRKRHQNGV